MSSVTGHCFKCVACLNTLHGSSERAREISELKSHRIVHRELIRWRIVKNRIYGKQFKGGTFF